MNLENFMDNFHESAQIRHSTPMCPECCSAENLMVETIQSCVPRVAGWVAVEYSCSKCEAYFAHNASVQDVAALLSNSPASAGVLHFGHHYIHCGEPMEPALIHLGLLKFSEGDLVDAPAATVKSSVLRCKCGFQMRTPNS